MPPQVSQQEFAWREWFLGEGRFKEHGPKNSAVRDQTGAPARIPREWWERLEEFLVRRDDSKEVTEKPPPVQRIAARLPKPREKDDSQLSPNFRLEEFKCHDGTPVPKASVPALRALCRDVLEPLRERFGSCHVSSGYRTRAHNMKIGGKKFSQHIYDDHPKSVAADLVFGRGRPSEWADAAESVCERGGLGRYSSFIHVDNRGSKARWSG